MTDDQHLSHIRSFTIPEKSELNRLGIETRKLICKIGLREIITVIYSEENLLRMMIRCNNHNNNMCILIYVYMDPVIFHDTVF
jgi:hypothetical protein